MLKFLSGCALGVASTIYMTTKTKNCRSHIGYNFPWMQKNKYVGCYRSTPSFLIPFRVQGFTYYEENKPNFSAIESIIKSQGWADKYLDEIKDNDPLWIKAEYPLTYKKDDYQYKIYYSKNNDLGGERCVYKNASCILDNIGLD